MNYYPYYVNRNAQITGEHEIHKENCNYLPTSENRLYLGNFCSFNDARQEALKYYTNVDGCAYCSPEGHKK